jgi:hypothetical protein
MKMKRLVTFLTICLICASTVLMFVPSVRAASVDIYLMSRDLYNSTQDLGTITFEPEPPPYPPVPNLPRMVTRETRPQRYQATFYPPSRHVIHHWEFDGGINVPDAGMPLALIDVYVTGPSPAILTAVYTEVPATIHLESREDDYSTSNLGTMDFDGAFSLNLPYNIQRVASGSPYQATYHLPSLHLFDHWETTEGIQVPDPDIGLTTDVWVNYDGTLRAVYKESQLPPYDATIAAYCYADGIDPHVQISPSGFTTPYMFTDLVGTNQFTVPSVDSSGHTFKEWSTGETSTTVEVSSAGTYTAYYDVNQKPIAVLDVDPDPHVVNIGANVWFDGANSFDPDGDQVVSFFFDFGDDENSGWVSYPQVGDTHVYDVPGEYWTRLKVKDHHGLEGDWCNPVQITVLPTPGSPVAILEATPLLQEIGLPVTFDASGSYDPDGWIELYYFDYGDDVKEWTSEPMRTHSYDQAGDFIAKVLVSDNDGLESWSQPKEVTITQSVNHPPSTPSTPQWEDGERILTQDSPVPARFTSQATDPDSSDSISLTFDWGDGNRETSGFVSSGSPVTLSHIWAKSGMFEIRAKATDNGNPPMESSWSSSREATVVKHDVQNSVWAGYFVQYSGQVKSVEAQWTMPQFGTDVYSVSGIWVGIGGYPATKLLQAGIRITTIPLIGAFMQAFWEDYPDSMAHMDFNLAHTISAGDIIWAKVGVSSVYPGRWKIEVKNLSKAWIWTEDNINYLPDQSTAEWIFEPGAQNLLTNNIPSSFEDVAFTDAKFEIDSTAYEFGSAHQIPGCSLNVINVYRGGIKCAEVLPISAYDNFQIMDTGRRPSSLVPVTSISLFSSASLHIYDQMGNHLGRSPISGLVELNINNSFYFEDQGVQRALLFNPDSYQLELIGEDDGDFHLNTKAMDNGTLTLDTWVNETITLGGIMTYSLIHQITLEGLESSRTIIGEGYGSSVTVMVANYGNYTESFNVAVYANTTLVQTKTTTLTSGEFTTLTFIWGTTGWAKGIYTLSAYATPIPGETDTLDNNWTGGIVTVTIVADINGDRRVDVLDLFELGKNYGLSHPSLENPNCDINDDNTVDRDDLHELSVNFGNFYLRYRRPIAILSVTPDPPIVLVGTDLWFSGADSYDFDGQVFSYFFDFGDGVTSGWIDSPVSSFAHAYSVPGAYSATLKVKDNEGLESDWSTPVIVTVTGAFTPVAYWKFDEGFGSVAHDSSGNNHDGTIYGAGWTNGISGTALQFDGFDDYDEVPDSPSLSGFTKLTLQAWIKVDTLSMQKGYVIAKSDGGEHPNTNDEYGLFIEGQTVNFHISDGGTGYLVFGTSPNTIDAIDRWYFIAATWNGSEYVIYIDGNVVASGTALPGQSSDGSTPLTLGQIGYCSWTYFDGAIDEVRVYNYARAAEEILGDYKAGSRLVGCWKFDEGSGDVAYDSSGNNNHGTIYGGAIWTTGIVNGALRFSGAWDNYVAFSSELSVNDAMTVEAWVYPAFDPADPAEYPPTGGRQIVRKSSSYDDTFWLASYSGRYYDPVNPIPYLSAAFFYEGGGDVGLTVLIPGLISKDHWSHIVATFKRNDYARLYVDGVEKLVVPTEDKPLRASSKKTVIGQVCDLVGGESYPVNYETWIGKIDEAKIHSEKIPRTTPKNSRQSEEPKTAQDNLCHIPPLQSHNGIPQNQRHPARHENTRPQEHQEHSGLHASGGLQRRRIRFACSVDLRRSQQTNRIRL